MKFSLLTWSCLNLKKCSSSLKCSYINPLQTSLLPYWGRVGVKLLKLIFKNKSLFNFLTLTFWSQFQKMFKKWCCTCATLSARRFNEVASIKCVEVQFQNTSKFMRFKSQLFQIDDTSLWNDSNEYIKISVLLNEKY